MVISIIGATKTLLKVEKGGGSWKNTFAPPTYILYIHN